MDLRITLKFLKSEPSLTPAVRLRPDINAFEMVEHDYATNNTSETILCLVVSKEVVHNLNFDLLSPVRRVVMDNTDLPFDITDDTLTLCLPAQTTNNDRAADMHMIISFKGVDLRLEVCRPNQRAGKYESGTFPFAARSAAMTVEFALLEAIKILGLDTDIGLGPCGPILLMGFDTNNPCGHTDWPPHVHLHMALPAYGAPVGHYYFNDDLLFSHNLLYYRKTKTSIERFDPGDSCIHRDHCGTVLFELTITEKGGLRLSSSNGKNATIEPISKGFDTGATVTYEDTVSYINLKISDEMGEVAVCSNYTLTTYSFDTDTGAYLGVIKEKDLVDSARLDQSPQTIRPVL